MIVTLIGGAVLLAAGYALGRYRPAQRASDWAHWQTYRPNRKRHDTRWWTVFTILSVENLAWIAAHPVQARHAWRHRNDPPPPRSPAIQIDPNWVENRRARLAHTDDQE